MCGNISRHNLTIRAEVSLEDTDTYNNNNNNNNNNTYFGPETDGSETHASTRLDKISLKKVIVN